MLKIIISGSNGHMGRTVAAIAEQESDIKVVAGFDIGAAASSSSFPVYADPMEFSGQADVIVDFSSPAALDNLLLYCKAKKLPVVLCTTGYSTEQLRDIAAAAESVPVFRSGNMSLGVNLIADLARRAASVLGTGFDAEIIERHHRRKVDAPSGTALILADAVSGAMAEKPEYVYDRAARRTPRPDAEIGISSVRGGTIVGEHEVIFAGLDEVIEIRHTAYSRDVFAVGAVRAARFMAGVKRPGMYSMKDIL